MIGSLNLRTNCLLIFLTLVLSFSFDNTEEKNACLENLEELHFECNFSSGFFRGAAGSLAFSGLGKLQGAGNKSSGGNYQANPCPKGYNCADLGSITIEAARKGRWRDYIPGWGNGAYYSNPVVKGVHDAGRQFMSHPATQGAMFVGTSLISGGLLNSYRVFNTARLAARGGTQATKGLKITGFTRHGVNRAIGSAGRIGVKPNAILDAIKNPLKINKVVTDQFGRQSQRFIGQFGEVVVNPQTGRIISVNPTSSSKAIRLLKQLGR